MVESAFIQSATEVFTSVLGNSIACLKQLNTEAVSAEKATDEIIEAADNKIRINFFINSPVILKIDGEWQKY